MQDHDPDEPRDDPPFVCFCGFESKSERRIRSHTKQCAEWNATPEQREAWYAARDAEEDAAMRSEWLAQAKADAELPCLCAPEFEYVCAGCEARRYLGITEVPS